MRLKADWLDHPGTHAVFDALDGYGVWFVGGCVRNGLLDQPVHDIDICTDALPDQVMKRADEAGFKAIPTGIDHGTVTVVIQGRPYEITTLRRDIETDGRRAKVMFSKRLDDDAARRDFTMNALYATRKGAVLDPNGNGRQDLLARRVRFIGMPEDRITEDYLRILRFFRFFAWYADPQGGIDPEGLAACAIHLDGLNTLAHERIGAEMLKLLSAPDPSLAVAAMGQSGVLATLLPGADPQALALLIGLEGDRPADAIRRLAALGGKDVAQRLRLSRAETGRLARYRDGTENGIGPGFLGYQLGLAEAVDILLLRAALLQHMPQDSDVLAAERGAQAVFPVSATDLMPEFCGPALGERLKTLEEDWIASDFTLSKSDLLAR